MGHIPDGDALRVEKPTTDNVRMWHEKLWPALDAWERSFFDLRRLRAGKVDVNELYQKDPEKFLSRLYVTETLMPYMPVV
jgi:hypothetical protein